MKFPWTNKNIVVKGGNMRTMCLVPSHELLIKQKQEYKDRVQRMMLNRALALNLIVREDEAILRDIKCSDLGLTSWQIPLIKKQTLTSWVRTASIGCRLISICKVIPLSFNPSVSRLVVSSPCFTRLYDIEIDKLYNLLPVIQRLKEIEEEDPGWVRDYFEGIDQIRMEGYLSEPVLFDGGASFQVEISTKCDSQDKEELILDGFVLERVGATIA